MSLKEVPSALGRLMSRNATALPQSFARNGRRAASSAASSPAPAPEQQSDLQELESQSSFLSGRPAPEVVEGYDPVKRAEKRRFQLPRSRYALLSSAQVCDLPMLTTRPATSTGRRNTTAALCTRTSRRHPPTQRLASSCPAPSASRVSSRRTSRPSRRT